MFSYKGSPAGRVDQQPAGPGAQPRGRVLQRGGRGGTAPPPPATLRVTAGNLSNQRGKL